MASGSSPAASGADTSDSGVLPSSPKPLIPNPAVGGAGDGGGADAAGDGRPWSASWRPPPSSRDATAIGAAPPCATADEATKRRLLRRCLVTALRVWKAEYAATAAPEGKGAEAGATLGVGDDDDDAAEATAIQRGVQAAIVAATEAVAAAGESHGGDDADHSAARADAGVDGGDGDGNRVRRSGGCAACPPERRQGHGGSWS
mmetsp:Transcript_2487/g.8480  ORF Transcript_2487/g.8480 Transcript_2487/m.8480 type:complete len:203 (-) Transcript_2487:44-652(-)